MDEVSRLPTSARMRAAASAEGNLALANKTLAQIYAEHEGKVSDKWASYLFEYDRIFAEFRDKPLHLLEIGVQNGGSLEIWANFFANARKIIGCDIHPDCARLRYDDPRVAVVVGDANSGAAEAAILEHAPSLDIVIDDGSHRSGDIAKSFARYFPHLSDGGVFIVEDLHCSYWQEFEGGLYHPFSAIAFFKRLADVLNHEHWHVGKVRADILKGFAAKYGFSISEDCLETIHSIQFMSSACVVRKEERKRNRLNARVIVGTAEMVQPGTLALVHARPGADQTGNEWAARGMAPDEELPLRMRELADRNARIATLERTVAERDGEIAGLVRKTGERDARIEALCHDMGEREERIAGLDRALAERDARIEALGRAVDERDARIAGLNRSMADRDARVADLDRAVAERAREIAVLHNSKSWRLTAPLRFARRAPRLAANELRQHLSQRTRALYHRAPLPPALKLRIKHTLFSRAGPLFRHTVAYRDWQSWHREEQAPPQVAQAAPTPQLPDYVPPYEGEPPNNPLVKLIAFYLPQFHPIPENDAFWGKGFTEWTNVARAMPQFEGHYQPRLPGELGFYDLRVPQVQKRQIELAKQYGLHGFCFHFYWFAGKRLLEMPLEQFVSREDNDFRFCINWANENWTRRWDGKEHEVLIAQQHSPQDDLAFIEHVSRYLRDRRYIRIDGKPLLLVYRPGLLPSAQKTASRWRQWCRDNGVGEIYLAYTQSFDQADPAEYGFDAAIEFPPNLGRHPRVNHKINPSRDDFACNVFDWRAHVERSGQYEKPAFTLFRGICPSWDNTARRRNKGSILLGSSPEGYQEWLSNAVADTCRRFAKADERLIFVNAWNEWAEGAYLEPDNRYGYAYLCATRDALSQTDRAARSIVVVTHDCHPHGAQFLALNLARTYVEKFGLHVYLVTLGEGSLKPEFTKVASCYDLAHVGPASEEALAVACKLRSQGNVAAICNTTVCGSFVPTLKAAGLHCVSLVHELPGVIKQYGLQEAAQTIATESDRVVFPADVVANRFEQLAVLSAEKRVVRPQGLYKRNRIRHEHEIATARSELRQRLGLPSKSMVVLAVGYADQRKGVDLFAEAAIHVLRKRHNTAMVWLGPQEPGLMQQVRSRIAEEGLTAHFFFEELDVDTDIYYAGADVYAMSSREDPFPSVVLEALDAGLPVVAFADVGGFCDLVIESEGAVVPAFDTAAFGDALLRLLDSEECRATSAKLGRSLIASRFSFRKYAHDLLSLSGVGTARVSVVVPNYNYAHLLPERIRSIVAQTHPLYEIILLDDASTDDSLIVARDLIEVLDVPTRIIANKQNSGSVFRQWLRGVDAATGDYVWIAEADDSSNPDFLTEVMPPLSDPHVVMSYCESKQMASDGGILCDSYLEYVSDISSDKWRSAYVADGIREISQALAVKNTIPNISAVVSRRDVLLDVLRAHIDEIARFRIAGDWLTYTLLLERGKIAFSPRALNLHRRHDAGVTLGSNRAQHLAEIVAMQRLVRLRVPAAAAVQERANSYAQRVYDQFGLANPSGLHYGNGAALVEVRAAMGVSEVDNSPRGSSPPRNRENMNVFFLGAPGSFPLEQASDPMAALIRSGENTGNLLIGESVRRQLVFDRASDDITIYPREIESEFDVIVICASNFIYEGFDLTPLANFLDAVQLPCVMIGVGAQERDNIHREINLKPGTRRFLEIVSERSKLIGVRGQFSAEIMKELGIANVEVIGCPSIYEHLKRDLRIRGSRRVDRMRVCVNGSRNVAKYSVAPERLRSIEAQLVAQAIQLGGSFVAQNEVEEILLSRNLIAADAPIISRITDYYAPTIERSAVVKFFRNSCHVFFDIGIWGEFVRRFDFVCGSRLHGCMIALQNGVPAHFIAHDSRLREICELMEVPFTWIGDNVEEFSLIRAHAEADYSPFERKRGLLLERYKAFLETNGLCHRLG